MSTFWNVVQACVWIATRDERLVARIRSGEGLFEADQNISDYSLNSAEIRITVEAVHGESQPPDVTGARNVLADACAAGNVTVYGRERASGEIAQIPSMAWRIWKFGTICNTASSRRLPTCSIPKQSGGTSCACPPETCKAIGLFHVAATRFLYGSGIAGLTPSLRLPGQNEGGGCFGINSQRLWHWVPMGSPMSRKSVW